MKTSSQDGARRRLDFQEKPYRNKTFFVDIKTNAVNSKVHRRIDQLGGRAEGFLSKDVCLLITDRIDDGKNENEKDKMGDIATTSPIEATQSKVKVPLSRGKALLMQAKKKEVVSTGGMDPVSNAKLLGVEVQRVAHFLKESNKLLYKMRQSKCDKEVICDDMGLSPIRWKDKENMVVIKIEDLDQMFRPLLKHLDTLPIIRYDDDLISPFDTCVPLCRKTEKNGNRYSTQRKSMPVCKKGGYCEPCDYWYKCSLREHLNSEQHRKFVKNTMNFDKLDEIICKLPKLSDFIAQYTSDVTYKDDAPLLLSNPSLVDEQNGCPLSAVSKLDQEDGGHLSLPPALEKEDRKQSLSPQSLRHIHNQALLSPPVLEDSRVLATGNNLKDKSASHSSSVNGVKDVSSTCTAQNENAGLTSVSNLNINYIQLSETSKKEVIECQIPTPVESGKKEKGDETDSGTGEEIQEGERDSKLTECGTTTDILGDENVSEHTMHSVRSDSVLSFECKHNTSRFNTAVCNRELPNHNKVSFSCEDQDNAVFTSFSQQVINATDSVPMDTYSGATEPYQSSDLRNLTNSDRGKDEKSLVTSFRDVFRNIDVVMEDCENLDVHPNVFPMSSPHSTKSNGSFCFVEVTSNWLRDMSQNKSDNIKSDVQNIRNDLTPSTDQLDIEMTLDPQQMTSDIVSNDSNLSQKSNTVAAEAVPNNVSKSVTEVRETVSEKSMSSCHDGSSYSFSSFTTSQHYDKVNESKMTQFIHKEQSQYCVQQNMSEQHNMESNDDLSLISLPETPRCDNSRSSLSNVNSYAPVSRFSQYSDYSEKITSFKNILQNTCDSSSAGSECDTPKAVDDSVFTESNPDLPHKLEPIKLKINLSDVKVKPVKKSKRVLKGKRRIMSEPVKDQYTKVSYRAVQQSETRLKLCRVETTPVQKNHDIRNFWKVRKSGGCRLVFSSGKRKAERLNSNSSDVSPNRNYHTTKRKRLYCD